jgi:hypothetical protein
MITWHLVKDGNIKIIKNIPDTAPIDVLQHQSGPLIIHGQTLINKPVYNKVRVGSIVMKKFTQ